MGDYLNAIIIGLVEGVTEFLPVSSTGHMILAGYILGWESETAKSFQVFIQLGAISAVVWLYFWRFKCLFDLSVRDPLGPGLRGVPGLVKLGLACVPAVILGALLHRFIKSELFSPFTVGIGFIVGAILILVVEKIDKPPVIHSVDDLTVGHAFGIGVFQCLGLWPGMSRSGSTIIGGLVLGCSRSVAAEFSFLAAVPLMCAATGYDIYQSMDSLSTSAIPLFAVGFVVAFLSALLTVKALIGFVSRHKLTVFAHYRIVTGLLIIWLLQ